MAEKKALIWNKEAETMPRPQLEKLHGERLKKLVAYVIEKVPFYRELYGEAGVSADDIESWADIAKLPLTVKLDLRDFYPSITLPRVRWPRSICRQSRVGSYRSRSK